MTEQLIDLTKLDFWLIVLCAVVFVSPLNVIRYKTIAWATLNCSFILVILQWHSLFVFTAVGIIYIILQSAAGKHRNLATLFLAVILVFLFLLHKSSVLADLPALSPAKTILSVIGFSYITLRMTELLRAVFEGRHPSPSLISTINYLMPFHMLAAGPIQSYDDFVAKPIEPRTANFQVTLEGIERIVLGLFKKFVLAYLIQQTFLTGFQSNGLYFLLEVQFFFLWLYLDFSAYSDIAIGIGRLIGVPTPENFNQPYLARNVIDFWERWHITLSLFIRRNIFIPLQLFLNRRDGGAKPLLSASIAFTIAFVTCGLWHGLTINFMLWGGVHALGLITTNFYKSYLKKKLGTRGVKEYLTKKPTLYFARFITYEYVAFSLVILFFP